MWNTLRTLVNRTGLTFNALKTSVFYAEDYNQVNENLEYLKERSDITDTLTGGTATQILTKNTLNDFDFSWQDAPAGGGGGQLLYDIIVAPTGGDYALLSSALAVATTGQTIFVKSGTYTESNVLDFYDYAQNLVIIGEDKNTTIITLNGALYGPTGLFVNEKNPAFFNLTFTSGLSNQHLINANCNNNALAGFQFENCIFQTTSTSCYNWLTAINIATGTRAIVNNCFFVGAPTNGSQAIYIAGNTVHFTNNVLNFNSNSTQYTLHIQGEYNVVTGNFIYSMNSWGTYLAGAHITFANNVCYNLHDVTNKAVLSAHGSDNVINGNVFITRRDGFNLTMPIINLGGNRQIFNSNRIGKTDNGTYTSNFIINLTGSYCMINGNILGKISSGNHIVDTGTGNVDSANIKLV